MTDSQTDSQTPETNPGPSNPQAEGMDAPTPPGGPQRQDSEGEGHYTGEHDDDASASQANDKSAEEAGGHTIPIGDEQPDPHADSEEAEQEENAESSLHQPSEG